MENKNYTITYKGALRVKMIHEKSGTEIYSDAPVDNNGKGESFSPTDLLVSSLVSCILTIAGIHYEKKGIVLKPINCDVKKVMYPAPRRIGEIAIDFDFGENDFGEKDKEIFKRITATCPVTLSINSEIILKTNL
ncbi:MAG: OsmC family protein [Crocinitomix sp.]|nr:OsmC family protein [Crocinitomix sp.]